MNAPLRRALAATGTLALSAALVVGGASAAQAYPASIGEVDAVVFTNPNVVDAQIGGELENELVDLQSLGLGSVTLFDGGDGSVGTWSAALAGADLFVLPEQEEGQFYTKGGSAWLSDAAFGALKNWVDAGGHMIVNGNYSEPPYENDGTIYTPSTNVDLLGGFTCLDFSGQLYADDDGGEAFGSTNEESVQLLDAELFAFYPSWDLVQPLPLPTPLPYIDGTYPYYYGDFSASVAAITTPTYLSTDGESMAVGTFGVGNGAVIYLAYDWYDGTDPDWYNVLESAAAGELPYATQPVANCALAATGTEFPTTPVLVLGGVLLLGGLAVVVARRRVAS